MTEVKGVKNVERVGAGLYVSLPSGGNGVQIEATLSYHAIWRGQEVRLSMSGRISQWRDEPFGPWHFHPSHAEQGRYKTGESEGDRGPEVSETARYRLGDACRDDAFAWVESEEAKTALADAYYRACVREMSDICPYDFNADRGERLLAQYAGNMGEANAARLRTLSDAWRGWVVAIEEAKSH